MQKEYIFVIISGLLGGLIVFGGAIFLKAGMSLFQFPFTVQTLCVLLLAPFIMLNKELRKVRGSIWLWILYGFGSAITIFCEYAAITLGASVAITVLLLYTQPLWTIAIGKIFLKEKLTKIKLISCAIVLIGAAILINPFGAEPSSMPGIVIALIGGIGLSMWVVMGSVMSKKKNHPITIKIINSAMVVILFALFYPLLLMFTSDPAVVNLTLDLSPMIWIGLFAFTIVVQILNHISYYKGVRKVPATDAGIILLLEPVTGALLAAAFLSQPLTFNIIIGGALILLANYFIIKKQ